MIIQSIIHLSSPVPSPAGHIEHHVHHVPMPVQAVPYKLHHKVLIRLTLEQVHMHLL